MYDEVLDRLKKAYAKVTIGNPLESGTLCGPMHTKASVKEFAETIEEIKKAGGKVEYGGEVLNRPGNYVKPALITGRVKV